MSTSPLRTLALLTGCLVAATAPAQGTADPSPLRIIVPVATGGTSDMLARLLAERFAPTLRRPVVVENKVGGTGRLAIDVLRTSPAGATLLVAPVAMTVLAPMADAKYDASELAPVSRLVTFDYALAVGPARPCPTFAAFASEARRRADVSIAGQGIASMPHLLALRIADTIQVRAEYVPYVSIATLETQLAGGHLASATAATSDIVALHRAGRICIVATTGDTRSIAAVPTFRELGYPAIVAVGWNALFASTRMPPADIAALARRTRVVLDDPEVRRKIAEQGAVAAPSTPAELATLIEADKARWAPVMRKAGLAAGP